MPSTPASGPLASSHRLLNELRERIQESGQDISVVITILMQAIESPGKLYSVTTCTV